MDRGPLVLGLILLASVLSTTQAQSPATVVVAFSSTVGLIGVQSEGESNVYVYVNCSASALSQQPEHRTFAPLQQGQPSPLTYCNSMRWMDYAVVSFGSAVALSPDGRWGFILAEDYITVLNMEAGGTLAYTLSYTYNLSPQSSHYQLLDPSNKVVGGYADPCSPSGWLCKPGTGLAVSPPDHSRANASNTVGVLHASCAYDLKTASTANAVRLYCDYLIHNDGRLEPISPAFPLTHTSGFYLQTKAIASPPTTLAATITNNNTSSNATAVLLCLGQGFSGCQSMWLYVFPNLPQGVKVPGCLSSPSLAMDNDYVVIGCPSLGQVIIYSLVGQGTAYLLSPSNIVGFGQTLSLSGDVLIVGSTNSALLYNISSSSLTSDNKNHNDNHSYNNHNNLDNARYRRRVPLGATLASTQPELQLPNYLYPHTLPLKSFVGSIPSPQSVVIIPSGFESTEGFTSDIATFQACPAGKAYTPFFFVCTECLKGQYKSDDGFGLCALCPEGTAAAATGSSQCTPCNIDNNRDNNQARNTRHRREHNDASQIVSVCPAGSPTVYTYDARDVQQSVFSPAFRPALPLDLETAFYAMCWPIFIWCTLGVILLGALLLLLSLLFAEHPAWLFAAVCMHKFNLFYHEEKHDKHDDHDNNDEHDEDEDSHDMPSVDNTSEEIQGVVTINHEEDEEVDDSFDEGEAEDEPLLHKSQVEKQSWSTVDGFLKWMGFLFSIFFFAVIAMFVVFSITYLAFAVHHSEIVYKTVPNDRSLNEHWLNVPILHLNVSFVGSNPAHCNQVNLQVTSSSLGIHQTRFFYSIDDLTSVGRCNMAIDIIHQQMSRSGDGIQIAFVPGVLGLAPFYTQAIEYTLSVTYSHSQSVTAMSEPTSSGEGWARVSGIILPSLGMGNILQGSIAMALTGTFRPVVECELPKKPAAKALTTFFSTADLEMECSEPTEESSKLYSVRSVDLLNPGVVADQFWAVNSSFTLAISLQDGEFTTWVMQLESTSYGEVITMALLTLIGTYELFHFFFTPFHTLVGYIVQQKQKQKKFKQLVEKTLKRVKSFIPKNK